LVGLNGDIEQDEATLKRHLDAYDRMANEEGLTREPKTPPRGGRDHMPRGG
jgi:hypothetical protein